MRRLFAFLVVLCTLLLVTATFAQQAADDVIRKLGEMGSADGGTWKFQHPAAAGGEAVELDDSEWPGVRPEHKWDFPDTEAWYRQRIVIPEMVAGVPVSRSALTLTCAVDDDMEVFVNGTSRGEFHWDEGKVVLTDNAQPGEEIVVAIRAINGPGNGRLMSASLNWGVFDGFREKAAEFRSRLLFCKQLLGSKRIADEGEGYVTALDEAVGEIDFAAIGKGDQEGFQASLDASLAGLAPFSKLAKQYTIYLVGHAHIDMNWLWLWPETKHVCRITWDQALKFMDEFPEFRFTQSQPGAYIAIEEESPELFARMQAAVARGQWEPAGASWVEGDTNMASGEALARQCLLTDRYYMDKFGKRSRVAWLPDNFGHAWTVPSIFADAGYKYFYFCRAGKGIPTFWWTGPDGQRLLAYNHRWYNEQFRASRGVVPLQVESAVGVPACMIVYGVGDHGGGPTRIDIETAKRLQADPVFPTVKFATAEDYFQDTEKQSGDVLPVVNDELNFTFEGCYTSHSDVKRWNRDSENILPVAESIAAIAGHWGHEYPGQAFTQAWRNTCFNQFHDLLPGTAIHDSYKYSGELYEQAMSLASGAIDTGLETLTDRVDTRGEGQAILVWNPVAWDRRECVEVIVPTESQWPGAKVTTAEGEEIPTQVLASAEAESGNSATLQFVADLPAMGYAVFHAQAAPAQDGASNEPGPSPTPEMLRPSTPLLVWRC